MRPMKIAVRICVLSTFLSTSGAHAIDVETETLFVQNDSTCYRIPALAADDSGGLLAVVERRRGLDAHNGEGRGDCRDWGHVDLVARGSSDGGRTWTDTVRLMPPDVFSQAGYTTVAAGNPTIVPLGGKGRFLVVFAVTRSETTDNSASCVVKERLPTRCGGVAADHGLYAIETTDGGRNWGRPRPVRAGEATNDPTVYPGPGSGRRLADGRLAIPVYGHVLLSDDGGKSWRSTAVPRLAG